MRWRGTAAFVLAGMAVAAVLVLVIAPHASSEPDGLEQVAAETGIDAGRQAHPLGGGPLAGYSAPDVAGVDGDSGIGTGLAGVAGVLATFGLGAGLFALLRWSRGRTRT